jgi:hypothetical protein
LSSAILSLDPNTKDEEEKVNKLRPNNLPWFRQNMFERPLIIEIEERSIESRTEEPKE